MTPKLIIITGRVAFLAIVAPAILGAAALAGLHVYLTERRDEQRRCEVEREAMRGELMHQVTHRDLERACIQASFEAAAVARRACHVQE